MKGIIRNKRQQLVKAKQNIRGRFHKNDNPRSHLLVDPNSQRFYDTGKNPLVEFEMNKIQIPPEWIDQYQECTYLIRQIQELKKIMAIQQTRRFTCLKQTEEKSIQLKIYNCATEAANKIRKCESILLNIQYQATKQSDLHKKTCQGICKKLASEIQQKTRELRAQQKAFIQYRKQIDSSTKVSFLELTAQKMLEDPYGFDDDKLQMEEQIVFDNQRNQELLNIVSSIHELNQIIKELNYLVIVQGSLIDRIDINISDSQVIVHKAVETLGSAEKKQKFGKKIGCYAIVILLVLILILGIVIIIKNR